jgi:hypothetical protein
MTFTVLRERDDRWGRATALGVGDDGRLTALDRRDGEVRRTQIYANSFRHLEVSLVS